MIVSSFSVIGGDLRSVRAANRLAGLGFDVTVFGFGKDTDFLPGIKHAPVLQDAVEGIDCVVLPLPFSKDGVHINTPLFKESLTIEALTDCLKTENAVFAGKTTPLFKATLEAKGVSLQDYSTREEFAVLNAIPTAEGAIQIAMNTLPVTLNGSSVLVIGYGRIGKVLTGFLKGLGAHVTLCARKKRDLAFARAGGISSLPLEELASYADAFQVIFSTVPAMVLPREILSKMKKDVLIIDLASSPGSVDFFSAEKLGIRAISALSLPGKVAPQTAGDIICDTVLNIISEREVIV